MYAFSNVGLNGIAGTSGPAAAEPARPGRITPAPKSGGDFRPDATYLIVFMNNQDFPRFPRCLQDGLFIQAVVAYANRECASEMPSFSKCEAASSAR